MRIAGREYCSLVLFLFSVIMIEYCGGIVAKIPEKVGKYKILSLVGKGGMGVVYAAEHPTLKRKVILKKLTIRNKEFRERFRLEADLMMDLRSDYIVDMYDHFRDGSSYYIAMEFIEGITLEDLINKEDSIAYDLLVYIMSCTLKALSYIHERGIIHRDIKPSNIYISKTGEVKLGDFGIAASTTRNVKITDSGSAMGTPAYMAPEQFNDSSSVDKRADIFSFGVMLYEMVTGAKPFRAEKFTELKQEIERGKYKNPTKFKRKISMYLRWIIFRSLMVNRSFRPKDLKSISNRFKQELKKISITEVKEHLSNLANPKKVKKQGNLTEIVKETGKRSKGIPILIFLGIISMIFLISILLFSFVYGILNLQMIPSVEDGKYTVYSELPAYVKQIKNGYFNRKGNRSLLLKEGSYRIRIESGSTVIWRSVYISTLNDTGGQNTNLTVLSSPADQFPVDLSFSLKDRFSGTDLSSQTVIKIKDGDEWLLFDDTIRNSLTTGRSLDIKFDHTGYVSAFYTLDIAYYQTVVHLDVLMTPEPAVLNILPQKNMIKINGNNEYFSLISLKFEKIPQKQENEIILNLLPGKYIITVESDDGNIEKEIILISGGVSQFEETK